MATQGSTVKHFFVYNDTFGAREETVGCAFVSACCVHRFAQETEKLLMFWPADLTMDDKMSIVGLSEALFKFTRYTITQ